MPTRLHFDAALPSIAPPTFVAPVTPATPRFRVAPQVMSSPPRSVCWTPRTVRVRLLVWAISAATFLAAGVGAWWDAARWNALLYRGVVVSAIVYDYHKAILDHEHSVHDYTALYRFRVDGVSISGFVPLTPAECHAPKRMKSVPLTYLPGSQPLYYETGAITPVRRDERLWAWIVGGLVAGVAGGAGVVLTEYNAARERRLLRNGIAVIGRITTRPTPRTNRLEYEFDAPDGTIRRGVVSLPARAYRVWGKRQSLVVLYDVTEPTNHLLREALTLAREVR